MARSDGYAQCPKCGTWRKDGWELTFHIQACRQFRCPLCGMPASDGHICHNGNYLVSRDAKGTLACTAPAIWQAHLSPQEIDTALSRGRIA